MNRSCGVAIVGAGPYGLSLASHLRHNSIPYRTFGIPMETWRAAMPKGMFLKSEVFASSLADPDRRRTLERYCLENSLPEIAAGAPVPVTTFIDYGLAFAREHVPDVEESTVISLSGGSSAFDIGLSTGERLTARNVVLALGTTCFKYVPETLATVPAEHVSHSADHHDLSRFAGREVVVVGAGQSALETAALLNEGGAKVCVAARAPKIQWNPPKLVDPSLLQRLRHPQTGLGRGWRFWFYCNGQELFRHLPEAMRVELVRKELGPAGAPWLADRVMGRIPMLEGHVVRSASVQNARVRLSLVDRDGAARDLRAEHVIAATGFKVDVQSIAFLDPDLARRIARIQTAPALSGTFESSVPGLYFAGLAAATTFGPSMRFVVGAEYAARTIGRAVRLALRHRASVSLTPVGESIAS